MANNLISVNQCTDLSSEISVLQHLQMGGKASTIEIRFELNPNFELFQEQSLPPFRAFGGGGRKAMT